MRVLVACEYSGIVRDAFRALGHDAWSCDVLCCERGPEFHIRRDVLGILGDGWDLMVAHPPCTFLSYAGTAHWDKPGRAAKREAALRFFLKCYEAPIPRVAIENPLGYPHVAFRRPDQTINPFQFGDRKRKRICLWLRGLAPLVPTNEVPPPPPAYLQTRNGRVKNQWSMDALRGSCPTRAQRRSRFFPGIAQAMAAQWSDAILTAHANAREAPAC